MLKWLCVLIIVVLPKVKSQTINGYSNVSAISGVTITVNNVDETGDTFEDGEYCVIMQMQDNCIGSNTTNVSTFGDLSAIQSAGRYEIVRISSHTESAGLPVTVVLTGALVNTYNIGANTSVQLISFPSFGSPNYTTVSNLSAKAWNGITGGVLAFQVSGTLTLAHNLSVNGLGFRGGAVSANYYAGGSGCSTTEYIRTSNHTRAGTKGEGIYKTATTDFLYSRGHLLNGGGGGSEIINCGGGGGGNYTTGGQGGDGWSCAGPGGGGLGGASFSTQISATRIFMGGGGGGGQQNNSASTAGGNGGGIILLKATSLISTGTCGGRLISANGSTVTGSTNDGQGGGGAGGSIVIEVNSFSVVSACALTVSANGGGGGTVNTSAHAGGGGGAQGVVIFSVAQPTSNITTQVNNGPAGCNDNSSPCTTPAGVPTGTNNSGIIANGATPLPITLIYFTGYYNKEGYVVLKWETLSEYNNDYFEVQRSGNGVNWELVEVVKASQTKSGGIYSCIDWSTKPGEKKYYRLKQVDTDLEFSYSPTIYLDNSTQFNFEVTVFPNPSQNNFYVHLKGLPLNALVEFSLFDAMGQSVYRSNFQNETGSYAIQKITTETFKGGVYFFEIKSGDKKQLIKVFIQD